MSGLLLTGASGQLGSYLLEALGNRGHSVVAWGGSRPRAAVISLDLTDDSAIRRSFHAVHPQVVIHAAAMARVSDCFRNPERANQVNVHATQQLVEESARIGARFVYISTDMVFDGEHAPYREEDVPRPVSVYGASKAAAERIVLQFSTSLVIRLSLLFGPAHSGGNAFFDEMLIGLRERRSITLFEDEWRTPIDYTTAATAIVKAAESQVTGILHVGGRERLSRLEMGVRLARWIGAEKDTIQVVRRADLPAGEPRPRDVSLDSTRWRSLFADLPWPSYEEALRSNEPRTK